MEFVTFKTAKKLKEKGYPHVERGSLAMYNEEGEIFSLCAALFDHYEYSFFDFNERDCVAPTISQALDWLREEKGIHIGIVVWEKGWYFDVWSFEFGEEEIEYETHNRHVSEDYKSYKEAALAGIEYVLDDLN